MLLKDKLILIFYVGVGGRPMLRANEVMHSTQMHFDRISDESTQFIYIPDFDSSTTHIEAVNPKSLKEEDCVALEKAIRKLERMVSKIEKEHDAKH